MHSLRERIAAEIPNLRRYARALAGSAIKADELVQACLQTASQDRDHRRATQGVRPWLFQILHQCHANSHNGEAGGNRSVFAAAHAPSEPETIGSVFDALPKEHRDALSLVSIEGLSYEHASQVLSISVETLRARLSEARETLRAKADAVPNQQDAGGAAP